MNDFDMLPPLENAFTWESQAEQYPASGPAGIAYFYGDMSDEYGEGAHVDCLLCRDLHGRLVGILNHYPQDLPPHERAGAVNVWVRPDRQRRGIGTALVREAMQRWTVDFHAQRYTDAGAELARALTKAR